MKKFPLSTDDFETIVNECFYIDKSNLINDLIDLPTGSVILYTRPRRFGKSVNKNMINCFYNINKKSDKIFSRLNISSSNTDYKKHLNKYPVIDLNLKDVLGSGKIEFIEQIKEAITEIYKKFEPFIFNKLQKDNQEFYLKMIEGNVNETKLSSSLYNLTNFLSEAYNKKCIVLIDEYDVPIQNSYEFGFYDECFEFFKRFFSKALKSNPNIQLAVLFGVQEIAKDSLFSGLNNLIVNNLSGNRKNEYFGFSKDETYELLKHYSKENEIDEICKWYGGYMFSGFEVFNPWSVINFLQNNFSYQPYWVNTGSNSLIGNLIQSKSEVIVNSLKSYMENNEIVSSLNTSMSFKDIANSAMSLNSFLVQAGYLSIKSKIDYNRFILGFPNEEIKELFKREINDRYLNFDSISLAATLKKALIKNNINEIKEKFEKYILSSLSYYDFSNEKNYQILCLAILIVLFDSSIVKSEVITGTGRCDILISPKNENEIGIAFEIKYLNSRSSHTRMEKSAKSALSQIKKNKYIDELKVRHAKPILVYGIAFHKKNICLESEFIY